MAPRLRAGSVTLPGTGFTQMSTLSLLLCRSRERVGELKLVGWAERSENPQENACDKEGKPYHPEGQPNELAFRQVAEVQPRFHAEKQSGELTSHKEYAKHHEQAAGKPQDPSRAPGNQPNQPAGSA